MTRILLAEDEQRISAFIEKGLHAEGFTVLTVHDGAAALTQARTGNHDLLILDIGLPQLDGFTVLSRLRAAGSRLPVIMLTARTGIADTVAGLQGGADDYIPKPFRFEELVARIRLRLRPQATSTEPTTLQHGELTLDRTTHRACVAGQDVELSAREFALLDALMQRPGQALTQEQLLSRVWGFEFDPGSNVVDVYVRYLRRKLGPAWIETLRGVGYRLTGPPPPDTCG